MPRFKIRHITCYRYNEPVRDSANQIMLYPIKDGQLDVTHHTISITGNPQIALFTDYFGNEVGSFTHPNPHQELIIDSKLEVITHSQILKEDIGSAEDQWKALERIRNQFQFMDFLRLESSVYLGEIEPVIQQEGSHEFTPLQAVKNLTAFIYNNFKYQKGITTVETKPDEIWKLKSGVCQDFANILLFMIRLIKIPARYVSGYICPDKQGLRGEGATHAWVEAYIPAVGWVGLDPTNNCIVNDAHVRLAVGKNFSDCSPVKGTYRGAADHTLEVTVSVQYEDGHLVKNQNEVIEALHDAAQSPNRNSYRRFQEQMQQ